MADHVVGSKGATVRSGVELTTAKVGRLKPRSVVRVESTATTSDDVVRAQVVGEISGWVSLWVLSPVGTQGCPGPWETSASCRISTRCGGYALDSNFCSGNLRAVRRGFDDAIETRAANDCRGQPWAWNHSAWFYFRMTRLAEGPEEVVLRCLSPSRQGALFRHGYRPVARRAGQDWHRIPLEGFSYRQVDLLEDQQEPSAGSSLDDDDKDDDVDEDDDDWRDDTFAEALAEAEELDDFFFFAEDEDDSDDDDDGESPWAAAVRSASQQLDPDDDDDENDARVVSYDDDDSEASSMMQSTLSKKTKKKKKQKKKKKTVGGSGTMKASVKPKKKKKIKKKKIQKKTKTRGSNGTELSWSWRFDVDETVEFAFCYPYSYEELQDRLGELEAEVFPDMYLKRELLTTSVLGRRIDMVTISEKPVRDGSLEGYFTKEGRLTNIQERKGGVGWTIELGGDDDMSSEGQDSDDNNRNDLSQQQQQQHVEPPKRIPFRVTPERLMEKKVDDDDDRLEVIVSARVHPGETPASYLVDGLLSYLVSEEAAELRKRTIFRVVPMLNPDGVALGHYRRDARGDDLNRQYADVDGTTHPSCAALLALAKDAHNLVAVIDCHAHASKRGIFLFGNYTPKLDVFPALLAGHSPTFEFDQCDFSRRKLRLTGSARVALRNLGLCDNDSIDDDQRIPRAYTLECNYNQGHNAGIRDSGPYTPGTWRDVGRCLGLAILDLVTDAPNVAKARAWLSNRLDPVPPPPSSSRTMPPPPPPLATTELLSCASLSET